ncbi:MAG: hypothetical protein HFI07_12525 [Lachnospiraceae bacterium]|nr:hypothetical protein [Lachnospiraceae bacterium]
MRNWMKRGMALMLAGVVMLSGASAGKVQATEDKKDTTSGDNVIIQEVEKEPDGPSSTSEFLTLSDAFQTPTVTHGQRVVIGLPVVNYSTVPLKDVVIKPRISNLVSEWPFEPNAAGATKAIKSFPAYDNKKNIEDMRQEIGFEFVVRSDVKSGYYKLEFDATYTRNGQVEKAVLTSYVKAVGTEESGSLDGDAEGDKEQVSKPRIIVTGFETVPAQVFAGETFTLTVHVKNTSQTANVTNVLFDMQAKEEGKDEDSKFAAFLPTSGSSSVYVDSIAPGASKDLVIEMSAKSDLSQKPYVLDVNMKYDAKDSVDLTDTASVSIPIYQEQRCETGDAEVMPSEISVGGQTNIMFDVYNTGKTTLYNVWVKFEGDSITGGDSFLGTIASGATGSVDAMVTGQAATMDDGKIKAVISYENESGVVTSMEKELELFVSEEMMGDFSDPSMGMEGDMMGMEEMEGGGGNKLILPIVAIAIVVLIVAVVVILRIRKKKKEQAELKADLEALNDTNGTDKW